MRIIGILPALCALWITGGATSQALSQEAAVTVLHGSTTETIDLNKEGADAVHIIRPAIRKSPPAPADRPKRRHRVKRTFVAGDTWWIRSPRNGGLVACYVGSSGMVGKDIIRCTGPDAFGR
jgi:hypothetical protein